MTDFIDLKKAAELSPGQPCMPTVWRWAREGVRARNGKRIRLQHRRCGGKLFTTREWLDEFFKATSDEDCKYFDATLAEAGV